MQDNIQDNNNSYDEEVYNDNNEIENQDENIEPSTQILYWHVLKPKEKKEMKSTEKEEALKNTKELSLYNKKNHQQELKNIKTLPKDQQTQARKELIKNYKENKVCSYKRLCMIKHIFKKPKNHEN